MIKWTDTEHCQSRVHCKACMRKEKFRQSIMKNYEWDGECPFKTEIEYQKEVLGRMIKRGCSSCQKKRQEKYIASLK